MYRIIVSKIEAQLSKISDESIPLSENKLLYRTNVCIVSLKSKDFSISQGYYTKEIILYKNILSSPNKKICFNW